jgi:hypothetical protein
MANPRHQTETIWDKPEQIPKPDRRQNDIGEFFRDQVTDARDDIFNVMILEGWSGRPANLQTRSDDTSIWLDRTEGNTAESRKSPFESRWSEQDQARAKGDPEHVQELDFDR